jgi:hypothetical protein
MIIRPDIPSWGNQPCHKSQRWRRLLRMGKAAFSLWDPGGCNCPSCGCLPCALPTSGLSVLVSFGPSTGSVPYVGNSLPGGWADGGGTALPSSACCWDTGSPGIPIVSTEYCRIQIACYGTCTFFLFSVNNAGTYITGYCYAYGTGCRSTSGLNVCSLSYTCSPLDMVFTYGPYHWTFTP